MAEDSSEVTSTISKSKSSPSLSTSNSSSSTEQKSEIIISISSVHSKSLDDVKSVDLMDFNEQLPSRMVHGHSIPSGWLCNYDEDNDQYSFEYLGAEASGGAEPGSSGKMIEQVKVLTKDEETTAITPTIDNTAQTSRRPTLDVFECKYGYHFPTSPTSSMISDLAKEVQKQQAPGAVQRPKFRPVGFGKAKLTVLTDQEEQAKRLESMFPTATRPVVDQMIRIYHGREGLIKAALISLGYKRATEYGGQQQIAQSPIMLMMSKPASKKLFDKLISYFPDRDESLIKDLMYRHKEVEHEIISALVEARGDQAIASAGGAHRDAGHRARIDKNGAIMKLRYLKFLFPTSQETELYHLLHSNDLNAQKVIDEMEKKGHKRANIDEIIQNRKSQSQQMRAQQASMAAKDKAPVDDPMEKHKSRTKPMVSQARANNLRDNLKKNFESVDDAMLLLALEAADYSEPMARKFLAEMVPIDEAEYKQHYVMQREQEPAVVFYPCRCTQKGGTGLISSSTHAHEYVAIPKSVVECDNALALLKVDACTFTQDDFVKQKFSHAKGRTMNRALGSIFNTLEVKESLRRGASDCLRMGSSYEQYRALKSRPQPNKRASGRNANLAKGATLSLRSGRNPKLLYRTHPFFNDASAPRDFFLKT